MFRLKLGFYMHALVGSTSLLDFFGGAFVVKDCSFDQKRQVSCCSFVKFSWKQVRIPIRSVGSQVRTSQESELEFGRSDEIQSLPHSD